jgi:hypothetical protein
LTCINDVVVPSRMELLPVLDVCALRSGSF